jgi:hypothetical protein
MRYKRGAEYACTQCSGSTACQRLRDEPVDAAIAEAFFEAVAPVELDALAAARHWRPGYAFRLPRCGSGH